jgi:hypothetical protein
MKQEIKSIWVAALRSGEYEKGIGKLRDKDKFCCLGVLCDMHSKENSTEWKYNYYEHNSIELPEIVMEWAGLEEKNPELNKTSFNVMSLAYLNDSGYTFLQIADLIEAQL